MIEVGGSDGSLVSSGVTMASGVSIPCTCAPRGEGDAHVGDFLVDGLTDVGANEVGRGGVVTGGVVDGPHASGNPVTVGSKECFDSTTAIGICGEGGDGTVGVPCVTCLLDNAGHVQHDAVDVLGASDCLPHAVFVVLSLIHI